VPQGDSQLQTAIKTALSSGEPVGRFECEFVSREATSGDSAAVPRTRYIEMSIAHVPGATEQRLLLVGRDVTESHEMDRMKANFLSLVSHELRGPLQTIAGYLDLVLNGVGGQARGKSLEFLRRARAATTHMTALVDDLIFVSRRDAGQFHLVRQVTDVSTLVREQADEQEVIAQDRNVFSDRGCR